MNWPGARTRSPGETQAAGREFANHLKPGDVLALHGELGSGKTTFVQGLALGLGIHRQVSSPTFNLIHEYGTPPRLYHFDCYREQSIEKWRELGIVEYFDVGVIAALEWAENIEPLLPARAIHLKFEHGDADEERIIKVME